MRAVLLAAGVLMMMLGSCSASSGPFQTAAVCLRSDLEIQSFKSELREIAEEENLSVVDRSAGGADEYELLLRDGEERRRGDIVMMTFRGVEDEGFAVSDLGDDYQIAIGFSEGRDGSAARELAGRVLDRIGQRWRVVPSAPHQGTTPIADCS